MLKLLFTTDKYNYAAFISRLLLGIVMFPHGAQKLFGWFGGLGFEGSMNYFTQSAGLPWIVGFLIILIECVAAFLLILGIGSRLMAFSITVVSIGIVITSINEYFFMNWFGNQPAEGYEFFLLMIGLGLSVTITGGGAFSVDSLVLESEKNFSKNFRSI